MLTPARSFLLPHLLRQLLFLTHTTCFAPTNSTPFQASAEYDAAEYGVYPRIEAVSNPTLYAPRVNVIQNSSLCSTRNSPARDYTFIAPRGREATPTAVILDDDGELVWSGGDSRGIIYDFRTQRLEGENVLTYWAGDDMVRGHGSGEYHILDAAYNEIRTIKAGNELDGDLHEFLLLENNTALLTVYHIEPADLSSIGGPADAEVWESIFQEVDVNTNQVLFEWHARDHYDLVDTYRSRPEAEGGEVGDPFDWFHINSVAKDAAGNYLMSSRYTHSLTYIDGKSGEILWILGGKRNRFQDLSNGRATTFAGQHDARWYEEDAVITFFDNGADYDTHDAEFSRGIKLGVNLTAMTAEVLVEYVHPERLLSESQGSMQTLSNGNVLIGYGFLPAYAEFSPEGKALCSVHFAAGSAMYNGDVMTYRAFKMPWRGFPQTPPDAVLREGDLYVSWNGATEVRSWVVKAGHDAESDVAYEEVGRARKTGFETHIKQQDYRRRGRYVRVLALDQQQSVLGSSGVLDLGEEPWWVEVGNALTGRDGYMLGPFCIMMIAGLTAWLLQRRSRRGRRHGQEEGYTLVPQ